MKKGYLCQVIIIAIFLFTFQTLNSELAFAHKGHAGPPKVFMEESEALKTMLPEGGKVVKRKEVLKKEKYTEAVRKWGYSPDAGVHAYYISKGKNGDLLGALFIRTVEYKHGEIVLAVGYDRNGHLSGVKILSCPAKYVKDITESILNSGFLNNFLHLKTDDVVTTGKNYDKEPEESLRHIIAKGIEETAILVKIFQGL